MTALAPQVQASRAAAPRRVERVLMLAHRLPYPPDRGDRIRSFQLLRLLSRHFEMDIACTTDEPAWVQHHHLLRTMARRVHIQPISATVGRLRGLGALLAGRAVTPAIFYRRAMAEQVLQWHQQRPYDAVLTFCTGMVSYARLLTGGGPALGHPRFEPVGRHVLDLVDVDSIKWQAYARSSRPPIRWVYAAEGRRLRRVEAGALDHFDAISVVSAREAEAYRQHVGEHPGLTVVGNGVDVEYFGPLPDAADPAGPGEPVGPPTLCFVGVLNYKPNADGIAWFARQVMPPLRRRLPQARLLIVGRHPTQAIHDLASVPGVEVVGSVPDVRTYLGQSLAVVAPLLLARGLQNKVLEAMASRRAVVCSTQAAEGIDAVAGEHLLVADSPAAWCDALERVMTDPACRQRLAQAARQHVERTYGWEDRPSRDTSPAAAA